MKKVFVTFLITVFIVLELTLSSYAKIDYKKISKQYEEMIKQAIEEYIEPYKNESVPEEERILDYELSGIGLREGLQDEEIPTKFTTDFYVTTPNKENTIWKNRIILFIDLNYENGEYSIEKIADKPENYDKFLEEFEKYKTIINERTLSEASIKVAGKNTEYKNEQIMKISNYIYIIVGIISLAGIFFIFIKIKSIIKS